ncbi:MAG: response regulator [Spirochaetes bacterium]|jgi:CheY-like chemotaxis protein|nr:response regulator [Spirochaetota bacterium]
MQRHNGALPGGKRRLSVLVIEDERINQIVIKKLIENLGHTAMVAGTAQEGLDCLAAGGVDMVLMDVELPDLSGQEAVQRIRSGSAGASVRDVYVAAVTGHAAEGDRERILASGMDNYVLKPVTADDLETLFREATG